MAVKRRILLYDWGSASQSDLRDALECFDPETEIYSCDLSWKSYDTDPEFEERFVRILETHQITLCLSFDFFPLIAKICADRDMLYISWIYDCPHNTLYSETLSYGTNLVFTFDRIQMEKFRARGISQIYHLPLAVNVQRLDNMKRQVSMETLQQNFAAEISFVGSLYENNYYQQISYLPQELQGYLDGLCQSQLQLYGMDLLETSLDETILQELQKYVTLSMDEGYAVGYQELFCDEFLRKNISYMERADALRRLGERYQTVLYTNDTWRDPQVVYRGVVHYRNQMPLVFMASQLNLNCTIRSIRSGIPLRCLDIMGAGGVLLSNYQLELEEYFVEGKEWICFHNMEELVDKAGFYLKQETLREQIANQGYQRVKQAFTYQHALDKMFQIAGKYI